ncbi:hypothetical protein A6A20_11630 [Volucribacter amazonae]|uniref:HTH tetR-type domain-containing protein n=2 Tax=Volucribacter amazonae TaxID=256731 RepID=A0A9X4SJ21_9PAST|nr:hypothetical protein [Volucribacter amazonae]
MKTDLRIIKTHQHIRQALVSLLAEQDYHSISVQAIIERAMVNRSTFYQHYQGKDDLVAKMIADFKQEYADIVQQRLHTECLADFFQRSIARLYQQRQLILALWQIHTPRHHLYQDMLLMLKQAFSQLADKQQQQVNDFQATLFATITLTAMKYQLEHQPFSFAQFLQYQQQIFSIMQTA